MLEPLTSPASEKDATGRFPTMAVSERQAAEMLSLSQRSVFDLRKAGKLGFIKVGSRTVIPIRSLRLFIHQNTQRTNATGNVAAS